MRDSDLVRQPAARHIQFWEVRNMKKRAGEGNFRDSARVKDLMIFINTVLALNESQRRELLKEAERLFGPSDGHNLLPEPETLSAGPR